MWSVMSTINMFKKEMGLFCLNDKPTDEFIENTTIDLFERIYRKAFNELYAMPEGDYIDICYEEFCKDPKGHLKKIYEHLGLEGYDRALPYFQKYLDSQKNYKKNHFELAMNCVRRSTAVWDFILSTTAIRCRTDKREVV